jgi:uncharacterized protein (DUF2147 family)
MKIILMSLLAVSALCAPALADDNKVFGNWARGDGNARVRIEQCGNDLCAINTWIKPGTPEEKAGDKLVMTVKPTGPGKMSGTAFDPQRDRSYRINLTVEDSAMVTQGCILGGLLCKGVNWTRIN